MSEQKPAVESTVATGVVLRARVPGWVIRAVMTFCAKERMRFMLNCVQVTRTEKSVLNRKEAIRVAGTDGRALMVIDLSIDEKRDAKPQSISKFSPVYLDSKDVIGLRPSDMLEVMPDGAMHILQQLGTEKDPLFKHRYDLRTQHEGTYPVYENIVNSGVGQLPLEGVFANPSILEKAVRVNKEVLCRTARGVGGVKWVGAGGKSVPFTSIVQHHWRVQFDDRDDYVNHNVEAVSVIMPCGE